MFNVQFAQDVPLTLPQIDCIRWYLPRSTHRTGRQACLFLPLENEGGQASLLPDIVKLMTMHSSKVLEFPMVAVMGIGYLPVRQAEPADEARLLYVAMTRATENLLLTLHRETPFIDQLRQRQAADESPRPVASSDGETRCTV